MTVYEGSRYQDALVLRVPDAAGVVRPAIYSVVSSDVSVAQYSTYVVGERERYDLIAYRLFGDPQLWWVIANLNPEYLYPDEIPEGTVIRIPVS